MNMAKSKKWDLNKTDYKNQLRSALVWLAPVGFFYFGQLFTALKSGNALQLKEFIPDSITIYSIEYYLVSQVYGLFLKLKAGK